ENDLLQRISEDPSFNVSLEQLQKIVKPENYVGRAPLQTTEFIDEVIKPILEENADLLGVEADIYV
ncbi:hypothetical protein RFW64_00065, partial [Acinetobacter baumannii]|nr:hypothetical protein [Acinetobacter baumannii]